jgi:hypothetical protein
VLTGLARIEERFDAFETACDSRHARIDARCEKAECQRNDTEKRVERAYTIYAVIASLAGMGIVAATYLR